jgi:hypothetical protein
MMRAQVYCVMGSDGSLSQNRVYPSHSTRQRAWVACFDCAYC